MVEMKDGASVKSLEAIASQLRGCIIENSHRTGTPHLGSCLSCVDILVAAYFGALKLDASDPRDASRDRFILSKGHGFPALAQVLALKNFFPRAMLDDYGKDGSVFAEHPPAPDYLPGIEAATGSLGHGLPMGLGMAMAARIQSRAYKVVALLSDGECNEGSTWEAAMLAAAQKVGNLCVVVDFNKWQATGRSEEVMALNPLVDKWRAFGWSAAEIDGHDIAALIKAMSEVPNGTNQPVAFIAHTVKGKGVSFMEDDNNWHYRIPTGDEVSAAKKELGIAEPEVA
jgi:transketolase